MKHIMLVLLSVSVMAGEILQSITLPASSSATFQLKSVNEGRGYINDNRIFKIYATWNGAAMNTAFVGRYNSSGVLLASEPLPWLSSTAFTMDYFNNQPSPALERNFVTAIETQAPAHGSYSFTANFTPTANTFDGPQVAYTPQPGFVGTDEIVFVYRAGMTDFESVRLAITITNTAPTIALSASPALILEGGSTSFLATTADANGHAVSVSYDYGDGNIGTSAEHVYASAGAYTVTATANDGFNGLATAQTTITVVGQSHIPKARIQTSEIVAFVNVPFTVDGTASTDEQNQPLSFSWNFGDESTLGSGSVLSHLFTTEGTRTIALTVTDSEGFRSTAALDIEVLSEQAAATFDSEIRVTSTYFPQKQNRDIVQVFARVNIGDAKLADGAAVALEYAGKRYATTLNKRLKSAGWTVKQNLRRQPFGTVEVSFKARNTAIASLLSGLGALNDAEIDVPFRLELGAKTIAIDVPTLFDVSLARGKGLGELD